MAQMEVVTATELAQYFEQLNDSVRALGEYLKLSTGNHNWKEYLNRDEAAEYLRIGTRMLDRLVADGKIARIKLGEANKSAVRFKKKDLDRFVEVHRVPSVDG